MYCEKITQYWNCPNPFIVSIKAKIDTKDYFYAHSARAWSLEERFIAQRVLCLDSRFYTALKHCFESLWNGSDQNSSDYTIAMELLINQQPVALEIIGASHDDQSVLTKAEFKKHFSLSSDEVDKPVSIDFESIFFNLTKEEYRIRKNIIWKGFQQLSNTSLPSEVSHA